jgi:cell division protein FtsW
MDRSILYAVLFLVFFGLVMLYSSSAILAADKHQTSAFFVGRQALRTLVGLVGLGAIYWLDYRRLRGRTAWVLWGFSLVLLLLCLVPNPLRVSVRGTHRWLQIGPLALQPADFARLTLAILLADLLAKAGPEGISTWRGLAKPAAVIVLVAAMVVVQPNLGSALAIGMIGAILLWLGGIRWRHLLAGAGTAAAGLLVWILSSSYHLERVRQFFSGAAETDPQKGGYQLHQSLMALGSGGIAGRGLGEGLQKWYFLPDAHTDFIFSIIGEEAGFLGAALVLIVFLFLFTRCVRVIRDAPDRFSFLLAAGMTASLAVYFFVNIGVATGLLPTTGLPLPFISYGGSSVISNLFAVGILLGLSSQGRRKAGSRV